jgi:uncharacterized protein YigA (DUF484 family)
MKEREVVLGHQKTIEIYQSTINSAENEKDRITSRMKELNHQGYNNQSTFDRLNKDLATIPPWSAIFISISF